MVQGVTPAHKGLAPSRLITYLRYGKDAHAGHTQRINKKGKQVLNGEVWACLRGRQIF